MSTGLDRYIGGSAITPNARQMEWLDLVEPSVQPSDALNDRWKKYLKARGYDSMRDWARAVSGNKSIALQDNLAALPFAGGYTETSSLSLDFAGSDYRVLDGGALTPKSFADIVTFTRASSATHFNSAGTLVTAATDAPRFDYDPVTLQPRGLLIEEARTNLLTYSSEFDNAAWIKGGSTVVANAVVAPDGTAIADRLTEDTSTSTSHRVFRSFSAVTNTAHTYSIFLKSDTRTWARVSLFDGSNTWSAFFNLATGVLGTVAGTGATAKIESVGNGWYRCSISATGAFTQVATNLATADNVIIYTGDGTSGIYIWGAQLEAGAFPTSYIPTVASQVTRAADVASVNTLSPWYNATEGTLFVETQTFATAGFPGLTSLAPDFYVWQNASNSNIALGGRGSAGWAGVASSPLTGPKKVAAAYDLAGVANCVNGAAPLYVARAQTASATALYVGRTHAASGFLNGHIRTIRYFPRKLANSELQAITV